MRVSYLKELVMIVRGNHPHVEDHSQEVKVAAVAELKAKTGQDFGFNGRKWEEWLKANLPDEFF